MKHKYPSLRLLSALACVSLLTVANSLQAQYQFNTYAGATGAAGATDGLRSIARFSNPTGIARDAAGNLYVVSTSSHTIRKITPAGEVSTVAGAAGQSGSADGQGAAARFLYPWGIAISAGGTIYVSDAGNHTVRAIAADGTVTTLAGLAGTGGFANGSGAAARFSSPSGLAVMPNGDLLVCDYGNTLIRRVTPTGEVSTFAGQPGVWGMGNGPRLSATFNYPDGIAVDPSGRVYVVDTNNHVIRRIDLDGAVSTYAGVPGEAGYRDSYAGPALFRDPAGVVATDTGSLLVTDRGNRAIRRVTIGGFVTTIAGDPASTDAANGSGLDAAFNFPTGIVVSPYGQVYVSDTFDQTVREGLYHEPSVRDMNGDGSADLLWRNALNGDVGLWIMNGIAATDYRIVGQRENEWEVVGSGDFEGLGENDIVWQNRLTGGLSIWFMRGLERAATVDLAGLPAPWRVVGVADFDLDGQSDLLWRNEGTGEVGMWLMDGVTPKIAVGIGSLGTEWLVAGVGDFNADGETDIVWRNSSSGEVGLWLMAGIYPAVQMGIGSATLNWILTGAGDYNGDRQPDLVWRNTDNGDVGFWLMDGPYAASYVVNGNATSNWRLTR